MPTTVKLVARSGERKYLRIYWGTTEPSQHKGWSYHNAMKPVEDILDPLSNEPIHTAKADEFPNADDWPKTCEYCGEIAPKRFSNGVNYDIFYRFLYGNPPRELQPGDMFWADWHPKELDARGHLIITLPNGVMWDSMGTASNCHHGAISDHQCWDRQGNPDNPETLTFSPSIFFGQGTSQEWHGHLINGVLTP